MDINPEKRQLTLSVGELARLVANQHSSSNGPSFSLRGRLGSEAHRTYQNQRQKQSAYRQEVHLDVNLTEADESLTTDWQIRIRGRLDGLIEELDRTIIEEIKTVALNKTRFAQFSPADFPRHIRQLEIYLYLLTHKYPERTCDGRLVYINLPDGKKRAFDVPYRPDEIVPLIHHAVNMLIEREIRHNAEAEAKKKLAPSLAFPFETMRKGQDKISETVQASIKERRSLLLEAPTGLGKTVATLFATIKFALEHDKQVMFLTSKTTQQDLVFETAGMIKGEHPYPRVLLLRAKQKHCPLETDRCIPDECPYIEDFFLRCQESQSIEQALQKEIIHPDDVFDIGKQQTLCPHELQLMLCEEVDLIIGDYNYAFDPDVRLARLFEERDPSRLILIVDEAHNLPDRAKSYYSAKLELQVLREAAHKVEDGNYTNLSEVITRIAEQFEYYISEAPTDPDPYPIQFSHPSWEKIYNDFGNVLVPYWFRLMASDKPPLKPADGGSDLA